MISILYFQEVRGNNESKSLARFDSGCEWPFRWLYQLRSACLSKRVFNKRNSLNSHINSCTNASLTRTMCEYNARCFLQYIHISSNKTIAFSELENISEEMIRTRLFEFWTIENRCKFHVSKWQMWHRRVWKEMLNSVNVLRTYISSIRKWFIKHMDISREFDSNVFKRHVG